MEKSGGGISLQMLIIMHGRAQFLVSCQVKKKNKKPRKLERWKKFSQVLAGERQVLSFLRVKNATMPNNKSEGPLVISSSGLYTRLF